jgi:hypothetical protein
LVAVESKAAAQSPVQEDTVEQSPVVVEVLHLASGTAYLFQEVIAGVLDLLVSGLDSDPETV